jgi:hypothetical protein
MAQPFGGSPHSQPRGCAPETTFLHWHGGNPHSGFHGPVNQPWPRRWQNQHGHADQGSRRWSSEACVRHRPRRCFRTKRRQQPLQSEQVWEVVWMCPDDRNAFATAVFLVEDSHPADLPCNQGDEVGFLCRRLRCTRPSSPTGQ